MYKLTIGVIATSFFLVACGGETASEPVETAEAPAEAPVEQEQVESWVSPNPEVVVQGHCEGFGPQTPRDISNANGLNLADFTMAPAASELNLCNIHTHTNAEHKGPGFSVFISEEDDGGYACNNTADLTEAQLAPSEGAYKGVDPGETIEVHWVHSSCNVGPGEGLGACLTDDCTDPIFRVEAQVFLVVNDENALDFNDLAYGGVVDGFHQAKSIPSDTGTPVVFRGSTTGPAYDEQTCSPFNVTWSVRPQCAMVDINSLHRWAEDNPFNETKSHGVRDLVTEPDLLSPIEQAAGR